jgi:pSer/pThr/pTyr-binding forkhead associated (FHA) protein
VIKEDYISRFHCKIHYRETNKQYYIQDLGSSSGTFIQLLNPTLLKEGVILQMGEGEYLLKRLQVEDTICQVIFEATEGVMKG